MLNRSLATQLLLTTGAFTVWFLYLYFALHQNRRFWRDEPTDSHHSHSSAFRQLGQSYRHVAFNFNHFFYGLLTTYAIGQFLFVSYAWVNRANFPLNLETMELLKLQHVKRLVAGLPLYVKPSPDFIPLVYNPLYYYLVLPFTRLFGVNLLALRIASIVGAVGAYVVVFLAVRQGIRRVSQNPLRQGNAAQPWWFSNANWWALMAVGLMAAAFRVMDTYLDNAAADSWTLLTILLGTYLISLQRGRGVNLLGLLCLIAAFWLKQYGAVFTVGAVCYLTWREGLLRSWPYWLTAIVLGPLLYFMVPPQWFGPDFHYYTWAVPKQWMYFSLNSTVLRVIKLIVKHYGWLALSGGLLWLWLVWRNRRGVAIWHFMLPFALLSGPYVALDPGNNNNVFIPLGTWLIIVGVLGIHYLAKNSILSVRLGVPLLLFACSFALFAYWPTTVLIPPETDQVYADLIATVTELDGPVYAPGVGQLQDRELFYPAAHWVTLIDLIREPGADLCNQPLARDLLEPVIHPSGPAYILLEHPLEEDAMLSFLTEHYILDTDFGNRYMALRDSPKLLEMGWPTYLYRYTPALSTALRVTNRTDTVCG